MEREYLMENVLTTRSLIDSIKEETHYEDDKLLGSPVFLRTDQTGNHRLAILLVRKVISQTSKITGKVTPVKLLSVDLLSGTLISRMDAETFYKDSGLDISIPVTVKRDTIDMGTVKLYQEKGLKLMDHIRISLIKTGEVSQDDYLEYLQYSLFAYSNEFALILLQLSRTYRNNPEMTLHCGHCQKTFQRKVEGFVDGQLVIADCPYCQHKLQQIYHRSASSITYTDRYFLDYRNISSAKILPALAVSRTEKHADEKALDADPVFSIAEPVDVLQPSKTGKHVPLQETARMPSDRNPSPTAAANPLTGSHFVPAKPGRESASLLPQSMDSKQIIGLEEVKKSFFVIRHMLDPQNQCPLPAVFALQGDHGCGIGISLRFLSGYQPEDRKLHKLEKLTAESFQEAKCIIILCEKPPTRDIPWLPEALKNLKNGQVAFFIGNQACFNAFRKVCPKTWQLIIQIISFTSYTTEELLQIFSARMMAYGINVQELARYREALFTGKNAGEVIQMAAQIYFRHRLNLLDFPELQEDYLSEKEALLELANYERKAGIAPDDQTL